jgi:hypothetical protein
MVGRSMSGIRCAVGSGCTRGVTRSNVEQDVCSLLQDIPKSLFAYRRVIHFVPLSIRGFYKRIIMSAICRTSQMHQNSVQAVHNRSIWRRLCHKGVKGEARLKLDWPVNFSAKHLEKAKALQLDCEDWWSLIYTHALLCSHTLFTL